MYWSSLLWLGNITNIKDIERVNKTAVRVIMGKDVITYKKGLRELKLETLENKRNFLNMYQEKGLFPLHHSYFSR